ncbi:MAG: hypothetical protein ABFS56_09875 [Pseudomonadota bacterium]
MTKKYNFAFFGLTGSGKTCLLAALDMQRIEHPASYTSSLLPVDIKRPTGEPDTWTITEKQADILHKSSDRLEEAKHLLEQGLVPNGTELSTDFIFNYKLSSPQTGEFYAQLIDYGGELLHPQNASEDIAKELRDKLASMDGLLVLAPAHQGVSEKLNLLQKTIGLIHFNQPIVLLITKWDRLALLPSPTTTITISELPSPEHRDLYNALINKVGEDNCKAFPVSAFGECKRRRTPDGMEIPKQINPLASFGLLDAFIWLAQRLETIKSQHDVTQLQNYEQAVASYKKWLPFPSLSLLRLKCQGKEVMTLFPKDSDMAKRARQAGHQSSKRWWTRLRILLFLMIVIPLIIQTVQQTSEDKKNYDEVQRTLNDPNARFEDIKTMEHWLEEYYYTTPLSHPFSWLFVVTNGTAKYELDKSRNRSEHRFWQAIQETPSLVKKIEAANAYIKALSNGKHIGEAKAVVAQAEEALRQKREQQWWQPVQQAASVMAKLEAARAYQKALPNGTHKAEIQSIITPIEESLRDQKEQRLWQQVKESGSLTVKLEAARAYLKALPDGKRRAEINRIIAQMVEALREEEEERLWKLVLNAKSPRTKKEAAQTYLQAKPDGKLAAEAKNIVAQVDEILREEIEERWWQPVEQANAMAVKVKKAHAYLKALPNGQHAADAESIIVQYESQKEWATFTNDYYEFFNEGLFLDAALHLSQYQSKDAPQLQALKLQFLANVFNSLETQINRLLNRQRWSDAYDLLDQYSRWPKEFQDIQRRGKIRALRKKVQEAEDRYLYIAFLEAIDLERADNYLRSAPLQTMRIQVESYKENIIQIQNPLKLELVLARIEWGSLSDDNNVITVFMDGKKIIEVEEVEAVENSSTGEIGRYEFTERLNTHVTLKVKIVETNWLSSYDDNGQGSIVVRVADLDSLTLNLRPPQNEFTNKAVFRLEGIPSQPRLPDWGR